MAKRSKKEKSSNNNKHLTKCQEDLRDILQAYYSDPSYYDYNISDYEKGIINVWGNEDVLGVEQLKKSADGGKVEAMNLVAVAYYFGDYEKEAIKYWNMAVDKNQVDALYNLGLCYLMGEGVERDLAMAKKLLYKANKLDHPKAKLIIKKSKLNKWKEGEYNQDLSFINFSEEINPAPKMTIYENLVDHYNPVKRSHILNTKEAIKLFLSSNQNYRIIECREYDLVYVFGCVKRSLESENVKYLEYFKLGRLSRKINTCSVIELLNGAEGEVIEVNKYLSKADNEFIKKYRAA